VRNAFVLLKEYKAEKWPSGCMLCEVVAKIFFLLTHSCLVLMLCFALLCVAIFCLCPVSRKKEYIYIFFCDE